MALEATFAQGWSAPEYQRFDWAVAIFAAGIAIYFYLPFEPSLNILTALCALFFVLSWFCEQRGLKLYKILLPALLVLLGIGRSALHTAFEDAPKVPSYERSYNVTGWIEAVEKSGTGYRWRIRVSEMPGISSENLPLRVRVRVKPSGFAVGEAIKLRAIISRPPGPVVPGGYDPARRAYFDKLGGYGFAIGTPEAATIITTDPIEKFQRRLVTFRYGLADRIRNKAPPQTAGLQAALLTGVRAFIPQDQTEALRVAGLAHVLAISGLHMGLLAGGTYFLSTLLLACIAPLSRRYDVRKPAAIIGALAATAYLILSGGSVATQRAYIMAMIVFLAVLLDRKAFSMRSVTVAALITLMLHPESLISVGFQMSFAAVAALVVVYAEWNERRDYVYRSGILPKIKTNLATLTVTSFVAGTATSGFAVLHFNRIASYSLLGNMLAMPLFSFIVMPAALASLIALPFGLEEFPLAIMGWGLSSLLFVAEWVAGLSGAMAYVPAAPGWLIGVFGLAFLLSTLGTGLRRYSGFALTAICFLIWGQTPKPDLRISDTGQVAFWSAENDTLFVGRKRADRYGREQFMQRAGRPKSDVETYKDTLALCDRLACRFDVKGKKISVVSHPSEVAVECEVSDIVVLTVRRAGPVSRRNCGEILLDERSFKTLGAHDVYITDEGIDMRPANEKGRQRRPWS